MLAKWIAEIAASILSICSITAAFAQAAGSLNDLDAKILALLETGKFAEAIPLAELQLAEVEKAEPKNAVKVAERARRLGKLYWEMGRYADAEIRHKQALDGYTAALGSKHPEIGVALGYLGDVYRDQGRYTLAESTLKTALGIMRTADAGAHVIVGTVQNSLGRVYRVLERYAEAEALYNEALALQEAKYGPLNRYVGETVNNLAVIHHQQGHLEIAEDYYRRSRAIKEKALPADHIEIGRTLNNLATLLRRKGSLEEAEKLMRRSLAIREKSLGSAHAEVGQGYSNLGLILRMQRRFAEAAQAYNEALRIREAALGKNHPDVAQTLHNIAAMKRELGELEGVDQLYDRALEIYESVLTGDHDDITGTLMHKARALVDRRNWSEAIEDMRRAARNHRSVARREAYARRAPSAANLAQRSADLGFFARSLHRAVGSTISRENALSETFALAQQGQSSKAALALWQMALRQSQGKGGLAELLRERQDLGAEWQEKDEQLVTARIKGADIGNATSEKELANRIVAIDALIAEIDGRLAKEFPDYSAFASPEPILVEDARKGLREGEALIVFLDLPELKPFLEETFVWAVTKTDARWFRSDLGTGALAREVVALRCGLDTAAWWAKGTACAALSRATYSKADLKAGKMPPFDTARAHALYKSLLGDAEDLIQGKHLLIVPSGALTQLPFQVLVTAPPEPGKPTAWLAREHALTVLPSVASLDALRARPQAAAPGRKPYLAFANPLLDGKVDDEESRISAESAARRQDCRADKIEQMVFELSRDYAAHSASAALGTTADVDAVRRLEPVPQTATLVCGVKSAVGAAEDDIHLAERATETQVKSMNDKGALASYAVVNFATHGLVAGELKTLTEPGLVLTPPASRTDKDDGYLSASEVAALKFDADWVILSACNTAAGSAKDAEALSGLARAFFYAGARALLVSHWSVREKAAVELVTGAIAATKKGASRAEAMQRAMLTLADSANPETAHPSYWAPFVVVGEGAPASQ
jgi:CHAT domain-containing protein/tetratricopeptide (TPR) repeat protein